MAGTCEACRSTITVTQKRIKCTQCMHSYHSECINFNNESATRSQWKCPSCIAGQRKGGDNSNTPVRNTTKLNKEAFVNVSKNTKEAELSALPQLQQPLHTGALLTTTGIPSESQNIPSSDERSIVSQIENILDSKLSMLKKEIVEELKGSLSAEIRQELAAISTKYGQLEDSHTKLLSDHDILKQEFDVLQKKTTEDRGIIRDLQAQINKQQQWARMTNIEIVGLPETPNESTIQLAVKIACHAGVQLQPAQIESAHRVQPMQKIDGRPKPIVVKLQTRLLKDQIISGLRTTKGISTRDLGLSGAERRIFVNEHLTPENKQLLSAVKSRAKDKSYKFVWVRNCNIFLRRNEESPVVNICSARDLQKIV